MSVPCGMGVNEKSMTLDMTLELAIGGEQRAMSSYRGPIRIQGGCPR